MLTNYYSLKPGFLYIFVESFSLKIYLLNNFTFSIQIRRSIANFIFLTLLYLINLRKPAKKYPPLIARPLRGGGEYWPGH